MKIPAEFNRRMRREFPDLRIRWSKARNCWAIEQKVGRGALAPFRISEVDDSFIRARDGYWLVCYVQQNRKFGCPECNLELKSPIMRFAEVTCPYCKLRDKDARIMTGYFPLNTTLIEHLRSTDPRRDAIRKMAAKADAANDAMMKEKEKKFRNDIEAITYDDFNYMFGIQSVGYTGREKAWRKGT